MRFFRRVFIIVFALLPVVCLKAQQKEINFTSLTTVDGLSSNTVNAILKDSHGMIWVATEDGLDRFDGTRFTVYRHHPKDSTSLRANEILSLSEDKSGNLWIGTSGGSLSLYDRKNDAFIHYPVKSTPHTIHNNVIRSICSDHRGNIWIGHFEGVDILEPRTGRITPLHLNGGSAEKFSKISITLFEDRDRNMWVGTTQGLFKYSFNSKTITPFIHNAADPGSISGNNINAIVQDSLGNLWVGTDNGLNRLSPGTEQFNKVSNRNKNRESTAGNFISSIGIDGHKLWIGTRDGLDIINTSTGEISTFETDLRNIHSLSANAIKCIYIDKQGIYWLGTTRGGIDKYDKNLNLFNYVRSNAFDRNGLNAPVVNCFAENTNGEVFVATSEGISRFNPVTRLFQPFPIRSSITGRSQPGPITLQMTSNKKLLIGTGSDGLFVAEPQSGRYRQLLASPAETDLNSNEIYAVTELRNGNFLVGTNGDGINVLSNDFKVLTRYTPHPSRPNDRMLPFNGYIRDIKEDREGNIWIATHGGGLGVLNPLMNVFTNYNTNNSKIPNDKVLCLMEDSRGFMWAGTFGGGIACIDENSREIKLYSEQDGLQNSTVYKILEDQSHNMWVSTNKGISRIDVNTGKINNYTHHNGLQHNNFVRGAGISLSNGELFFGGLDGFNYFHPSYLIKNNNIPPVLLTGLKVSNQFISASKNGPISEHISSATDINLEYKQNFALDFVALGYTAPEQNKYAYKLEGFDKDWNFVGNTTTASYTNLDPGNYVFRVRASNNDGVWNNQGTSVAVHVHPPIWRTTYAYIAYFLFLTGLLIYIRHKGIQKIHRKFAMEQKKAYELQEKREAERIHELDSQKIKFLTNLSHEFRTPISLILGPVDSLIEKENNIQSFRQLDMIKRNGRRLLNLVNQLLDFRRMEEHELQLHITPGELVSFIKDVADSFKDLAERKKMDFVYNSTVDRLDALFDHDKLERVLFNVLSNAFKFTRAGGKIMLEINEVDSKPEPLKKWIAIRISDTGIGIANDKKEKIFNLFFQNDTDASILNQGSGIGLTITKEFVKMQGGTITIDSEAGVGTAFNILLPFPLAPGVKEVNHLSADDVPASARVMDAEISQIDSGEEYAEVPTILLVEDNDDFRFYLKGQLRLTHKVIEAANGVEGWKKALAHHPQIIVSDISMPEMNGNDLCRKLKADKRTSHIPVILLTALTGEEAQLQGLRTGANDYITKPFHVEVLNEKIKNLLRLNYSLKHTYTRQIKAIAPEVEIKSADEELLRDIVMYLDENLSNSQLSVNELSRHLGMSRSSLYAKILDLTGETPVEYIRSMKLNKAAVLLEKSDMNVTQIAYSVGFSTPNYFAKSFKAKFGALPSEYIVKTRNANKEK